MLGQGLRCRRLLILLLGLRLCGLRRRSRGLRRRRRRSRSACFSHRLELLKRLLIERRLCSLLRAVLVAHDVGRLLGKLLADVLRHVEVGQFLIALLEDVGGIDESRLVEDDLRAIEDEPPDGQPDDDGDVDRLTESRPRPFVVERIQKVDQLMFFEIAVAIGAHPNWRSGRARR